MVTLAGRLKELGLSEYEAKVYLSLVALGKSGASAISAQSGVPHAKVYGALESLIRKGLVAVALEKPRKWYAQPPSTVLARLLEDKFAEMTKLKKEIDELGRRYERLPEEAVYVMKGKENFSRILRMLKKPQKYEYRIKWSFEWRPEWARLDSEFRRRGIDIRTMGPINDQTRENLRRWLRQEKIRQFPNEGAPVWFLDDEVVVITLVSSDAIMVIRDKPFVKLLKDLYLAAWEKAKPIAQKELA